MGTTYTGNLGLGKPAAGDRSWDVPLNANSDKLDKLTALNTLSVITTEQPSTSLNVFIQGGAYSLQDGTLVHYPADNVVTMPASSVRYLYLDLTQPNPSSADGIGLLVLGTAWPAVTHVRLAQVLAGTSSILNINDQRIAYHAIGPMLDGTALEIGTSGGFKIGTATTQKIGFLNATPAAQQTGGALTAAGTYGANEQTMLQKAYNALRTFGFLS